MTREQAIQILRTQYPHDAVIKEALGLLIPELRESEDERMTRAINNMLPFIPDEAYANNGVTKEGVLNWLEKQKEPKHAPDDLQKSFEAGQTSIVDSPEQYGLCKKAEWSDEDEKIRNLAIEWAETMYGQFRFVDMGSTDFRKIVAWLKSLRPSWKPSEEQMEALNKVRTLNPGLDALYQQLKNM